MPSRRCSRANSFFACWGCSHVSSECQSHCSIPIIGCRSFAGRVIPALRRYAESARIGRYYATESMLALDQQTGLYDARNTPSTGSETLFKYYAELVRGVTLAERGDHAVF